MPQLTRPGRSWIAGGLLAALTSGCASVPRIELDGRSSARIGKIALLKVAAVPSPTVANSGGAAAALGLVGAVAQAAVDANHGLTYASAFGARTAALAPATTEALADALSKDGYEVVTLQEEAKVAGDGDDVDLSAVRTDADAILAVWFTTVGYVSPPRSPAYQPVVVMKARMIDARSRGDLWFKTYIGGYDMRVNDAVYVPSGQQYRYDSFDVLMDAGAESVEGMVDVIEAIVARMFFELKKK